MIDVTVCAKSGLLKTPACNEGDVTLPFLEGTQPGQYCNIHGNASWSMENTMSVMRSDILGIEEDLLLGSLTMPTLPLDMLPELSSPSEPPVNQNNRNTNNRTNTSANRNSRSTTQNPLFWSFNNNNPPVENPQETAEQPSAVFEKPAPEEHEAVEIDTGFNGVMPAEPVTGGQAGSAPVTHNAEPDNGLELPPYNPLLD
jgi:penicillin-binding protein 1A